jgi:hypothetical protein
MKTLPLDAPAPSPRAEPRRSSRAAERPAFDDVLSGAHGAGAQEARERDLSAREHGDAQDEGASAGVGTDGAAAGPPSAPPDAVAGDAACAAAAAATAAALVAIACGVRPSPSPAEKLASIEGTGFARGQGQVASSLAAGALAAPGTLLSAAEDTCGRDGATAAGATAAGAAASPMGARAVAGGLEASSKGREGAGHGEDDRAADPSRTSRGAAADLTAQAAVPDLPPIAPPPDAMLGGSVLGAPAAQPRDPDIVEPGNASARGPLLPPDVRSADGAVLRNAAHLRVEAPGLGELELHLRVRDGVAHVRIDGEAAHAVEARAAELSRALASEGLKLGQLDAKHAAAPLASSSADAGFGQQRGGSGREHHEPPHVPGPPSGPHRAPAAPGASRTSSGRYTVRA